MEQKASFTRNPIVQTWEGSSARRRRTLPELLAYRQLCGKPSTSRVGHLSRRGIPMNLMSSRGAWNTKRMQNMILVVGPNTPASLLMGCHRLVPPLSSSSASSSPSEASAIEEEDGERQDDVVPMEEEVATPRSSGRSRWVRQQRPASEEDDKSDQDEGEVDDEGEGEVEDQDQENREALENLLMNYYPNHEESESEESSVDLPTDTSSLDPVPSMRHGGCINTAAWLSCGWRISTNGDSREALTTEECPTQLVTSGDDLLVKFWDVSHAMGISPPLSGGYATICPFSSPNVSHGQDSTQSKWKRYYSGIHSDILAGSVVPLVTLSTGHSNNVFHVTPLYGHPGKVATCAADGFLRLADLETGISRVVVSPEYEDDIGGLFRGGLMSLRPGMCFSHHFLSQKTGLLCSERGLRPFDLRLPPREQSTRSLLGGSYRGCKSCAIWSKSQSTSSLEESDSAYVFVGGSSAEVVLCDLRMTDGASSRVIQKYCPQNLALADIISVSGIDISRDGRELLVSYESDQIYTFPIFPRSRCSAGPTVDEIGRLSDERQTEVLPELACYGGHLNRFTFLKNAKYAGPRDEYICTGSDSGRAWIYDKATGSVVSFLNADNSTCNGVIPHPSLPFFITYGIDSTAKLWRATVPVDLNVDDSVEGRRKYARTAPYCMSPTVRSWDDVQKHLSKLNVEDIMQFTDVFPDQIPSSKDIRHRGTFGSRVLLRETGDVPRIGNDLHNLPGILLKNFFACLRGLFRDDLPVESGVRDLKHRISLIRLRHQADMLGLPWNPSLPWQLEPPTTGRKPGFKALLEIHPADLVPDFPSDWLPYDPEMTKSPWDFDNYFNKKDYNDFYYERYMALQEDEPTSCIADLAEPEDHDASRRSEKSAERGDEDSENKVVSSFDDGQVPANNHGVEICCKRSVLKHLYETIKLLKDAGNVALLEENLDLAARRYDKAILYGAIVTMSIPSNHLRFATLEGYHLEWDPFIKVLISTRLNLTLLLLKAHFSQYEEAAEQAKRALHDLGPFCVTMGMIMMGADLDKVHRENEPEQNYLEAKALQAKAWFRLGSAQYELGEYCDAISSFEKSVQSTQLAKAKPDSLVIRRLAEAKREKRQKSKRHRKKFKFAFATNENNEAKCQSESDS